MAVTMLVTQALNELKTLDGRINKAITDGIFVAGAKASDKNILPGMYKEDFNGEAVASKKSADDLIKWREKVKAAVVASNAITFVPDLGMTVAKAIETKASIKYKKALLNRMKSQYQRAVAEVNQNNARVEQAVKDLVNTAYASSGSKDKSKSYSESDYEAIATPYKKAHEWELVDPLDIKKVIDALEEEIREFESKVDSALQISNCVTTITIEE